MNEPRADVDAIKRVYGLQVMLGAGPTTFAPASNVTREQMAVFVYRLLGRASAPTPSWRRMASLT